MFLRLSISSLVMMLATLFVQPSFAQEDKDAVDPVFVFNRICFSQVPKLQGIKNMAVQLAWNQVAGEDLARFSTVEKPDVLLGWDASLSGRLYRVGLVQHALTEKMQTQFPDFSNGKATSCSLVLDGEDLATDVIANMQILAGREPVSTDVAEGPLKTTTWAGGNDDFKVFLFAKSSQEASAQASASLLNVTILSKQAD